MDVSLVFSRLVLRRSHVNVHACHDMSCLGLRPPGGTEAVRTLCNCRRKPKPSRTIKQPLISLKTLKTRTLYPNLSQAIYISAAAGVQVVAGKKKMPIPSMRRSAKSLSAPQSCRGDQPGPSGKTPPRRDLCCLSAPSNAARRIAGTPGAVPADQTRKERKKSHHNEIRNERGRKLNQNKAYSTERPRFGVFVAKRG